MSRFEVANKVAELKRLEEAVAEIASKADAIRNEIKDEMNLRGVEEMVAGSYIVRFTSVLSSRFDTKKFKEVWGEHTYNFFLRQVPSKRFAIV